MAALYGPWCELGDTYATWCGCRIHFTRPTPDQQLVAELTPAERRQVTGTCRECGRRTQLTGEGGTVGSHYPQAERYDWPPPPTCIGSFRPAVDGSIFTP